MPIVKPAPGAAPYRGTVAAIDTSESNFKGQDGRPKMQYKFTFTNGDIFFVDVEKAERQVMFNNLGYITDFIGKDIDISKVDNPDHTKRYINILLAKSPPVTRTAPQPIRTPGNAKQPFSAGAAHIPGLDDFDIIGDNAVGETDAEFAARMGASAQPAVAATRPAATASTLVPTLIEKHEAAQRMYEKHFAWAVEKIVPQCSEHGLNYDLDAINGVIATVMIQGYK